MKSRQGPLTLDELILWGVSSRKTLIDEFGALAEARAEWARRRGLYGGTTGSQIPEAFWQLDGPRHLMEAATPPAGATYDDVVRLDEELQVRRERWLARRGVGWLDVTPGGIER